MDLRQKLSSLYVVGKDVEFEDSDGNRFSVWLQKLSPIQKEAVVRRANARRQAVLAVKRRPQQDESVKPFVDQVLADFSERDLMIEFLEAEDINNEREKREAEIAANDEWSKDGYLDGLLDAWEGDLNYKDAWIADPNAPEPKRVKEELSRFADEVEKAMETARRRIHRDYEDISDDELVEKLVEKAIDVQADIRWLETFRRGELQMSVRYPDDHNELVFKEYEDLENLQSEVLEALFAAYGEIQVNISEGKE